MHIQDALKETGKAVRTVHANNYAAIKYFSLASSKQLGGDRLYWFDVETSEENSPVQLEAILSDDWQPYHEVKEIRPEYMGELWQYKNECGEGKQTLVTIFKWEPTGGKLRLQYVDHTVSHIVGKLEWHKDIIHNKNGWKRLVPLVEDDSVERIEIGAVTWGECDCGFNYPMGGQGSLQNNYRMFNKPPMKMILEIPKEDI